jgi:hypothetical protein
MKLGLLVGIPPERMQLLESRFNSIVQPDLESGDLSQRFREFLEVEGDQSPINRLLKAANQVLSLSLCVCVRRARALAYTLGHSIYQVQKTLAPAVLHMKLRLKNFPYKVYACFSW